MKRSILNIIVGTCIITFTGCDKGFRELNVDPNASTSIDAKFLFTNAELSTHSAIMENEPTIVQQFINPFGGVSGAFNFNSLNHTYTPQRWNGTFPASVKQLTQVLEQTKSDPAKANLYQAARIWRAYQFMTLVDTYGDVPYSEAGKGYLESKFTPKYDKQTDIYADLVKELTEASAALDASKDVIGGDIFYNGEVAKWKRLGYSLLLRAGMRYSKTDAGKAQDIVKAAVAGGVMQSNGDNCYIRYNTLFTNPATAPLHQLTNTYYLAEPFITHLKTAKDPRLKYFAATYSDPGKAPSLVGDTVSADQFGLPVGYDASTLKDAPGFRGSKGAGFNYSQLNYAIFAKITAPQFLITYGQTQLLLAEAAFKGWITGNAATFYEDGVKAAMDQLATYDASAVVTTAEKNAFLANPFNAYSAANALQRINTQYWVASFANGAEAWANFRRSGFPALTPNNYPGKQIKGSFVRRFAYPLNEAITNLANYQAAVASIGGSDDLDTPVFWDK